MSQKMKSKECSKFVLQARAEYARLSAKKEKGKLIDAVIQLVGYKSGKTGHQGTRKQSECSWGQKAGRAQNNF